jgi:hypothetical protein
MEAPNDVINSIQCKLSGEFLPNLTNESISNCFKIFLLEFQISYLKKNLL